MGILAVVVLMGVQWEAPAGAVLAAAVTATVAWWLAHRRQSGSVRSSEAGELWTAYDRVMERVEADNAVLRADLASTRIELATAKTRIAGLEAEVGHLKQRLRDAGINHDE